MQQRHKEEQQLLLQLREVARLRQAEHMAQKARKKVEERPGRKLRDRELWRRRRGRGGWWNTSNGSGTRC